MTRKRTYLKWSREATEACKDIGWSKRELEDYMLLHENPQRPFMHKGRIYNFRIKRGKMLVDKGVMQ